MPHFFRSFRPTREADRLISRVSTIRMAAMEKARAEAEKKRQEEEGIEPEVEATPGDGRTVVEVSKLVRPGTALSGTVKFASGSTADWYVDSYGRLGIENLQGDKPTESDIMAFQDELKKALGQ